MDEEEYYRYIVDKVRLGVCDYNANCGLRCPFFPSNPADSPKCNCGTDAMRAARLAYAQARLGTRDLASAAYDDIFKQLRG
jgi:hypothetical protein